MHKTFYPTFFFLLFSQFLLGQNAAISGKVIDPQSEEVLAYTTVSLFRLSDSSLLNQILSSKEGFFSFNKLSKGHYYLRFNFLGYDPLQSPVYQLKGGEKLAIGNISLSPSQLLLEEIEISGRKNRSYIKADRKVYTTTEYDFVKGGNGLMALQILPSVNINSLGDISVRGSDGFVLMLDGKQTQSHPLILLQQIPANAIERIEIITTPSAKFDPDGKAGIINIITKAPILDGLFIWANAQLGLPSIERYENAEMSSRYGGDLTLNYKKGRWDFATSINYQRDDIGGRRIGYVNTYQNEILTEFPSYGERSFDRENYSGRLSLNFSPTKAQNLAVNFYAGKRTQYRTADILYDFQQRSFLPQEQFLGATAYGDFYEENGRLISTAQQLNSLTYFNENLRVRRGDFLLGSIDYSLKLKNSSHLKLSALYERTILGGPTDNNSLAWPNTADTLQLQFNDNDNPLDGLRLNVDYEKSLGNSKWETGYQFRYLFHPGEFIYLDRDLENNLWQRNPIFSNRIELRRKIHAFYSQLSNSNKRLTYNAGLRLEYMDRNLRTAAPDTAYQLNLLSLFPSIKLAYRLDGAWQLNGGYSRRIQRTTTFKMTPFPEREHSETLEQGDAELLPEFVNQWEVGISGSRQESNVYLNLYHRQVRDVINRVNTIYNDSILNRIYTNAGQAKVWGVELGTNFYPSEKWKIFTGGNLYNYQIIGDLFGDEINTANTIFSFNANVGYQVNNQLNIEANLNYLSRRVTAQGIDARFYNPTLSISHTFPKQKLTASLQWKYMDLGLLRSNEQRITTWRDNFYTTTNYIYEVDVIMLNLSFQLNQPSKKVKLLKSEFGDKEF